jgi:transcriptional regulator with XRE-family HTH domain
MLLERTRRTLLRKELREARLRAELRQVDVAKTLMKPQSYVAKVESGERRMDFIEVLSFCKAVDLDPHELIDRLT